MKFKHIYIEITNVCQFDCSFCPKTSRPASFISPSQFKKMAQEAAKYTKTIYLHVLGEPLIHPQLDEILAIADALGLLVNLTTNGYALAETAEILLQHHHIKKINISLHSMEDIAQQGRSLTQYLDSIVGFADQAITAIPTTIVYRLWNTNKQYSTIREFLQTYYHHEAIVPTNQPQNGIRLSHRVFLHQQEQFEWPVQAMQASPQIKSSKGYCLGLKTHLAMLANGDVVPCCLDGEGLLVLGNVLKEDLDAILASPRAVAMMEGFRRHRAVEDLCMTCTYKDRFAIDD